MADDTKEENKEQNLGQTFNNIEFERVEDKFSVTVEYDANSELLTLKLTNQTTKNVFKHNFDKDAVQKITMAYLTPELGAKMITDTLTSKELTKKNIRVFLLPNIKQATAKYDELRAFKKVPEAINIPTGFQPKLNNKNNENNQMENCLLFVLHFSAPPYIFFNYCFILKEKEVSDFDKLSMRLNDVKKENQSLQHTIKIQQQSLQAQQQQIDELTQRFQDLEARIPEETKMEEMDLVLQNNWQRHSQTYAAAKASKIGNVVYLKGLINSGTAQTITTLPEGWRPNSRRIFCQNQNAGAMRVDVCANGNILYHAGYKSGWIPLDGISFVM